jgi:hypothetical protein
MEWDGGQQWDGTEVGLALPARRLWVGHGTRSFVAPGLGAGVPPVAPEGQSNFAAIHIEALIVGRTPQGIAGDWTLGLDLWRSSLVGPSRPDLRTDSSPAGQRG